MLAGTAVDAVVEDAVPVFDGLTFTQAGGDVGIGFRQKAKIRRSSPSYGSRKRERGAVLLSM